MVKRHVFIHKICKNKPRLKHNINLKLNLAPQHLYILYVNTIFQIFTHKYTYTVLSNIV